jgi:DnaK suppressor protein
MKQRLETRPKVQRMTAIHYRRRIAEELENLVRSAMAADAAVRRPQVPLRAQSKIGRIQESTAIRTEARKSEMRQDQLMQAIRRLDDGAYGYCSDCAGLIEEERLRRDPCIQVCSLCAQSRS